MNLLAHWRRWRRLRKGRDSRPCAICALAPKIRLGEDMGRYCLYYGMRIAPDELNDVYAPLRQHCLGDGNSFTWPVTGMSYREMLEWRVKHSDWYIKRLQIKVATAAAVAGLIVAVIGLWVKA